jgi:hypothetical protein
MRSLEGQKSSSGGAAGVYQQLVEMELTEPGLQADSLPASSRSALCVHNDVSDFCLRHERSLHSDRP